MDALHDMDVNSFQRRLSALEQQTLGLTRARETDARRLEMLEAAVLEVGEPGRMPVRRAPVSPPRDARRAGPSGDRPRPPHVASVTPVPVPRLLNERLNDDQAPGLDVLGGRLLAWIGGVSVFAGVVFFLALAISHGWIGREARTLLAGAGSLLLLGAALWLHERRGQTEAARTAAGSAVAGLFATLVVATRVYDLLPAWVGLGLALAVGALAAALAVRWGAPAVAALGILGAVLSPALVGATPGAATVGLVLVASVAAAVVLVWQRWDWLALGVLACGVPQWGAWVLAGQRVLPTVLTLSAFGLLGIGVGAGHDLRTGSPRLRAIPVLVLALNVFMVALLGWFSLRAIGGARAGEAWLAALALVHLALGLNPPSVCRISPALRRVSLVIGVLLADLAFGLSAPALVLGLGWAAAAVLFAARSRRSPAGTDTDLLELAVGGHVALALLHALAVAPLDALGHNHALASIVSVCAVAAGAFASSRLLPKSSGVKREALAGLSLAAVAYLSALTLAGPALVLAFAAEVVALAELARRTRELFPVAGAAAFLTGALVISLTGAASPDALLFGARSLGSAAAELAAVASAAVSLASACGVLRSGGFRDADASIFTRRALLAVGAGAMLYLASIALISAFQPGPSEVSVSLLDLSVRQQGQVLLSVMWTLVGLGTLLIGLRTRHAPLRTVGLAVLLATTAKVFLYDLSTLESIYRVTSLIMLGILLLAGAYTWQRQRPLSG